MAGKRERLRAENTDEIKRLAREQLASGGASGLSLRAISRDLGMVSSAIYRYFPSRDELLTALIVDAYDSIGFAAERADASVVNRDLMARWIAVGSSAYQWASDHPAEYGLIFGTPVPGYAAPPDTIGPATRFTAVLLRLLIDADHAGRPQAGLQSPIPISVHNALNSMRARIGADIPDQLLGAGMLSWVALFGAISFIRFGHLHNVIDGHDAYFAGLLEQLGVGVLGLAAPYTAGAPS